MVPAWVLIALFSLGVGSALTEPSLYLGRDYSSHESGEYRVRPEVWIRTSPWHTAMIGPKQETRRVAVIVNLRGLRDQIVTVSVNGEIQHACWCGGETFYYTLGPGEHRFEARLADGTVSRTSLIVRRQEWEG